MTLAFVLIGAAAWLGISLIVVAMCVMASDGRYQAPEASENVAFAVVTAATPLREPTEA